MIKTHLSRASGFAALMDPARSHSAVSSAQADSSFLQESWPVRVVISAVDEVPAGWAKVVVGVTDTLACHRAVRWIGFGQRR